jgi:hypothetical protein
MCCQRSLLPLGAVLVLAVLGLASRAQAPANAKAAAEKLAADVAAGKKITAADAKAFAQKWDDLEEVMAVFKQGKKQPTLEAILNKLSEKKSHTDADKKTLKKIADLARALALVTPHYDYKTKGSVPKKKDWDKYTKEMAEGSQGLLEAIKKGQTKEIGSAATKLAASCTDCHGKFR